MATTWFIVPYTRKIEANGERPGSATRWADLNNHQDIIDTDAGAWAEVEVLGNRAVVKVRASQATLDTLAGLYLRIPLTALTMQLNQLTQAQRNRIHTELNDMGYTDPEIVSKLGAINNIGQRTLGEVLRFAATRRQVARFDVTSSSFILDGPIQACESIDALDTSIQ